jgi:glycosyltransferase involved in cell wall biosynthesis
MNFFWGLPCLEPLVSVCIRNFNYEKYISQAIESALAQTYPRTEVVVVDDGSTDRSRNVISRFGTRVRAEFQKNQASTAAANKCFDMASGQIIIYLDSDDLLYPSVVTEVVRAWTPETAKVQFQLLVIDGASQPKENSGFPDYPPDYGPNEVRREFLATGNYSWPPTTGNAYARGFLDKVLPLSRGHRFHDGTLNTIAPLLGEIRTIPRILGCYRVHGSNAWAISSVEPSQFAAHINQKQNEMELLRRYAVRSGIALPEGNLLDHLPYFLDMRLCAWKLQQDYPGRAEDSTGRLAVLSVKHLFHADMYTDRRLIHFIWRLLVAACRGTWAKRLIALRYDSSARPNFIDWIFKNALGRQGHDSRGFRLYPGAVILIAATAILRNFVDAPPFNVMNSIVQVCVLGAAMMLGGVTATIAAFLFILGVDFFLIDPVFALGVNDWRGLVELSIGSALALGFGITAARIFPALLGNPSQA